MLRSFQAVEKIFDGPFGQRCNPWYQLGALSFHFYWILVVTGIYLFVFFDTSIEGAYSSVEILTNEQWWLGGVMRSLHRYATDAMIVTVTLHIFREFAMGRFRGARWFSWSSGVPLLWLLFAAAIGGYWLVWDRFAQYIAVATSEWIDALPVLGGSLARNFLSNDSVKDRLLTLLVFVHIALPLFLVAGMFIHVKRLKLARTEAPRELLIGTTTALIVLSLAWPARSQGQADFSTMPAEVGFDWFSMNMYPMLESWGPGVAWAILAGGSLLLFVLPWLSPGRKEQNAVAVVDPNNCNGCGWCFQDCPFEAVTMIPHTEKPGHRQALIDPDLCTACGICEGACPSATPFRRVEELVSGIQIPAYRIETLRQRTMERIEALSGETRIVLFGCDHALDVVRLEREEPGLGAISLPCTGLLPPSFVDFVSRQRQVDGVLVTGCPPDNCYHRKGSEWIQERLEGRRMPHLRTSAGRGKLRVCWAGAGNGEPLRAAIASFRAELRTTRETGKEAAYEQAG